MGRRLRGTRETDSCWHRMKFVLRTGFRRTLVIGLSGGSAFALNCASGRADGLARQIGRGFPPPGGGFSAPI